MSGVGLFAIGLFVTLIVGTGLSLLVYAAILDGRDEALRKAVEADRVAVEAERMSARTNRGRSSARPQIQP